jgi:hypothetical protein
MPMIDASALRAFLDGPHGDVRDIGREWLSRPGNAAAEPVAAELEQAA